jgi:hypothetical protein
VTSVITIAGFSISISMALVVIAFILGEYSFDKSYPNSKHIYRVFANGNRASVREDFRESFLQNYPAIKYACRYNNYTTDLTSDDKPFTGQMIVTDSSFFNIFSTLFLIASRIDLNILFYPIRIMWLVLGVLIISFISGIYPTISISGLKPVSILMKQKSVQGKSLSLRALLNISRMPFQLL